MFPKGQRRKTLGVWMALQTHQVNICLMFGSGKEGAAGRGKEGHRVTGKDLGLIMNYLPTWSISEIYVSLLLIVTFSCLKWLFIAQFIYYAS